MDDEVVRQAPLFAALDDDAAQALLATMTRIRIGRGEAVFHEGDPGDRLYVIVEGKIKLGRASGDGRENLLAVLGPGEMFGELSLFDPGPRNATGTAIADTVLVGMGSDDLDAYAVALRTTTRTATAELLSRLDDPTGPPEKADDDAPLAPVVLLDARRRRRRDPDGVA